MQKQQIQRERNIRSPPPQLPGILSAQLRSRPRFSDEGVCLRLQSPALCDPNIRRTPQDCHMQHSFALKPSHSPGRCGSIAPFQHQAYSHCTPQTISLGRKGRLAHEHGRTHCVSGRWCCHFAVVFRIHKPHTAATQAHTHTHVDELARRYAFLTTTTNYFCTHSLTHPLTHPPTHPPTHSLTHPLTDSLTHVQPTHAHRPGVNEFGSTVPRKIKHVVSSAGNDVDLAPSN